MDKTKVVVTAALLIAIAPIAWQELIILNHSFSYDPILFLTLFSVALSLLTCFVSRRTHPVFVVPRKALQILDVCSVLLFAALLPVTLWVVLKTDSLGSEWAIFGDWFIYVERTVLFVWGVWLFISLCRGNTAKSLVALVFFFWALVYYTRVQSYTLPLPVNQLLTSWLLPVYAPIVFLLLTAFRRKMNLRKNPA